MTSATMPTPIPAMSSAMASGTVPSIDRNVTRTGCRFCSKKMISAITTTAAMQIPTHAAPARERVVFLIDGDPRFPGN